MTLLTPDEALRTIMYGDPGVETDPIRSVIQVNTKQGSIVRELSLELFPTGMEFEAEQD